MSEFINVFRYQGKSAEIVREDTGIYKVFFMENGTWTHETPCSNLNEATRLAENYISSKTQFLSE